MDVQHPIVRLTEDAVIYRASAAGGCPRALYAARLGMEAKPPPSDFSNEEGTGYFDQGAESEEIVKSLLIAEGFKIWDEQLEVQLRISDLTPDHWTTPCIIVGHIDGKITPPEGRYAAEAHLFEHLLEIKGFGASNWSKWKAGGLDAFPIYKFQVSCYMYALELADLCFVVWNKETNELDISFYETPPADLWQIELQILQVEELVKAGELVGNVTCTSNYPCPYYYVHDEPDQLTPALVATARVYNALRVKRDTAQDLMDKARDKLLDALDESGKYASGGVSVTVVDGRSYLDTEALRELMKEANISVDEFMKKSDKKSIRVTVK